MSADFECGNLKDVNIKNSGQVFMHELFHHLPYATVAVACALMLVSVLAMFLREEIAHAATVAHSHMSHSHTGCCGGHNSVMDILFHVFHFIHILFAVSGSMVTFYRYSTRVVMGVVVGVVTSVLFCTLSDVLVPYLAGLLMGIDMDLHICFFSEMPNIAPFLVVGAINGLVMFYVKEFKTGQNSLNLHFLHIFISALASTFYAIGHGFADFHVHLGIFYLLILGAVVLPCTISDVVIPIIFARMVDKK